MKRTILLAVAAIVALMSASCQKEEMGRILTATIEQYEHNDSKAYINNDHYACWENDDKVQINTVRCTVRVSEGNEHNYSATIEGQVPTGQDLLAFYPADMVDDLGASGGTVTLPHEQTYRKQNGHQVIDNPMAAYCPEGSNELRFRNLCGLLEVTVNTSESVRAIQVMGDDGQMLWGEALLKLNEQYLPVLGKFTNGSNSVVLLIPEDVTPVTNTFYIVVPGGTLFTNLTVAVLTTDGTTYTHHCKTNNIDQAVLRNQIGAFAYTPQGPQDNIFVPDWAIRYTAQEQVTPNESSTFGNANYIGCNFSNGIGYLLFDRPLTLIGNYSFSDCISLTSITLPETLILIGNEAFSNCPSLSSITLPENLTHIGGSAFQNCSSLSSITLPENLTSIGGSAFRNCSSLSSITLPAALFSIGDNAFSYCSNLSSITLPAALTSIEDNAFSYCSNLSSITLPAALISIGDYAFSYCSNLSSITLPENLTSIGVSAFQNCSSISSITLPAALTSIGTYAFSFCPELCRVDCYRKTPPTLGTDAFCDISRNAKLHVPINADYSSWESYFGGGIEHDL